MHPERESVRSMNQSTPRDRRRSERVLLQVHVIVWMEMPQGKQIHSDAYTLIVNAHGGLLEMEMKVVPGIRLVLANPKTEVKQACRVVRVEKSHTGSYEVAFEFDSPTPKFWPIVFPPADWELVAS
jgi:hypothetical protein